MLEPKRLKAGPAFILCLSLLILLHQAAWAANGLVHRYVATAISPDGSAIATVEGDVPPSGREPVVRDLVIRGTDGKSGVTVALPCGRVPECWPAAPAWTPDGRHLTFALRLPGSHARSIYQVAADGSGLKKLMAFDGTIIDLMYGRDGRLALLATVGATKEVGATQPGAPATGDLGGAVPEQRIAILDGDHLTWQSPADLFVYQYDWLPDGSGFAGTAAHGDGDDNWWVAHLYAFAGGKARELYVPDDQRHQIADPEVSPDGTKVAFIAGVMSDFGSTGGDVFTVPLAGGATVDITPKLAASATALGWSCSGALVARLLAGDQTEIAELGAAQPKILWHGAEGLGHVNLRGSCPSGAIAVSHESFTKPPEIAVGPVGAWHDATHENAGLSMKLTAQSVAWKSDGFTVQGWLLLPANASGRLPMITMVHGGPAAAAEPYFTGPGDARDLLDQGYAEFRPNPRGSFGEGAAFVAANVRDLAAGPLRDILAGIDAAAKVAPIDTARLGITGGSYGGYMTMWAVTQTDRFKAGVAAAGISNLLSYYGENGIDQWMIPYFGKSAYDDPAAYVAASPITFIRNTKTPTFAYVGALDIECPAPQTQEFWHALNELGVPTSYAIYPGEGHGLRDPKHLADAEARTIDWFKRYLK